MRKKFLLMTFLTLLFTAMGTSVLRAQGNVNVAKVGDTYYATLAEAIAASNPNGWGTEVTLLQDITLEGGYADPSEGLRIEKSVTINGAGHTIDCGIFNKGIRIYENGELASNVMFKNITIVNNNAQGRCIDTRSGSINLYMANTNLTADGVNSQPLTIGGSETMTKVTISGGTIDAGTSGYGVICFVPVTNHINVLGNAVIKGFAAFYLKEDVNNTSIKLAQSTSIGKNEHPSASGVFGAVVIEGSNNTVRLEDKDAVVKAVAGDGAEMAPQAAFLFRGNNNTVGYYNNATPQVITEGGQSYFVMVDANVTGTKFNNNGVEMVPEATTCDYQFMTIEEALRFADGGSTVKLLADVTLSETYENNKTLTIDLNGKTINVAYAESSTTNHIYAIDNKGTLKITGNGTINARGIFNYGAMTLENGTINAIDGNGGYGVRNYASATFTMDGGTIATTLEDDHQVDEGGYDATPVRVDEGATFTMNGGVINNICDFTVAIDNHGTTIITDGKATTVHTTLANHGTMTIDGGEFTCNGLEGITAHALWAADGTTTINGGTFNGKDNYNGFNVDASAGAIVNITGGNFLPVHSGSLYGDGTITVSGGTFFDEVPEERCAEGYIPQDNGNGTYGVVHAPAYGKVAKIGDVYYETLAEAVAAAQSGATITLLNGEHELPLFAGKELTFKGESKDGVIVNDAPAATTQGWNGSTFHFENLTAKGATANYHGLANGVVAVTYKNCNINGLRFLYSPTTFEDCAFNANGVEHSFWTYGASNVTVTRCTFTYTDRAVNCYSENGANHELHITFSDCDFEYDGSSDEPAGAVEINSSSVKSMDVAFTNDCTAPAKGAMWFNSQWDPKHGANTVVEVDGVVVWTAPAKIGETKYATLQEAVDAAQDGDVVTLIADVTEDEVLITQKADVDVTIDGNGKTFTGHMTIFGSGRHTGAETLTIQNVVFQAVVDEGECIASATNINGVNSYAHNVTIDGCSFNGNDTYSADNTFAIRFPSGGVGYDLTVTGCTADEKMFGLLWVTQVVGDLIVNNCTAEGVTEGIVLTSTAKATITNTTIDASNVAIRAGQAGAADGTINEFTFNNNTLKSDAIAIQIRGNATDANLSMTENVVSGTPHISGNTADTNISADANYWGEGLTGPVVDGTNVDVNSYYADEAREQLIVTALTLQQFVEKVTEGNGTYNGTFTEGGVEKNITVKVVPVSGDARTTDDVRVPNRLQKYTNPEVYYAQYQRFSELTDVNISNVNFVFYPAAVTVTDAWNTAGATTTADNINGELQLLNTGSVLFANCSFEKMSVSPINAATLSVTSSTFNGLDAYAIKDVKATTATITGTTFTDCNGGFWFNNAPTTLTVTDNTFAGTGRRGAIQFSANGDYANTEMTVTGNEVTDDAAFLWQLNNTISNAQLNAILDKNNNTYETAFVAGSVELHLQGEGTADNPYLINDISDLEFFRDDVNADPGNNYAGKYIKLTADIDLNNEEWTPIGNNTNKFQGYFDGNEKTISKLKISGNNDYVGLFGYILGQGMSASITPSVKDLKLENVDVSGDYYVGGLAGQAYTCNITNVTVKGNVSGVRYVGGLVGHVYTYFKDCHFIGNASCSFDALGGIAGAGDCRAYDCSVIGDITGSNWVGGIVGNGQEGTSAVGCYVKGVVKTSNNYYRGVGGIAGVAGHGYASSEFKNNYFDGEVYLEDVKVPAMIMGLVNADDNASIKATVEGNSWNTDYYDVNALVYVVAEISSSDASLEEWITGASEELTKPRNNNLIMLESDLPYVTEEDYVIMSFSEVTEEQVEQALINNAVAKIGETTYTTLQKALDAAVAGTGNVTVEIIKDINLTNVDWNPVTVSAPGYPLVTVEGNGKTITGLNDMLFAGTWAGNSGLIIKNLTIKESNIVHDENDTAGTIGVGAFIGYPQASATITLYNCHLENSTVKGGHWTGGLIGMAGGYNGNDGPVFMNLTIEGCSVTGSTITGKGSCGGIIGHGSCAAWTAVNIQNTTVSGNTVTSTGSSTNKAGAVMGTIGAAGQPTTANGVTLTGGAMVSATVADNTVTSGGTTITTIYGRQGTETGMLELNGGSYDKYPIEEGVAYAAPAEGYKIEQNENGTYGVVVDPAYGKVAMIGDVYYETLAEAHTAATDGQTITLINNITLSGKFVIAKSITLDGNDKTLTYTGTDRAIDVPNDANANIDVTIKNLTVVATTANRGLNYNENGEFNVEGVTVTIGENVDGYAINFPGFADGATVNIKNSKLTSRNPLNIWGENMIINVTDSEITSVDNSDTYNYAAIQLNNEIPTVGPNGAIANGTVVTVTGGKITALDETGEPSLAVANATETGVVNISETTVVVGKQVNYVLNIAGVYFASLQEAIDAIEKYGYNSPIVVMKSFATSETATVKNGLNVTINLNGKTITGTDNATGSFGLIEIQPGAELIINDSSDDKSGKITLTATNNREWNAYSSVISNQRGMLTVNAGTIEHLGGTDMAYGIDNLTNGQGTYAETVINGGTIKSTYRGIRQFLNGVEAQNFLTVTGGTIEGANKSIWMQDPSANANTGTLTVGVNAKLIGDVYLYVTPNSTSWPVEVSIAAGALQGESTVMTANVPAGYELKLEDGVYGVKHGVAKIGDVLYESLAEAATAATTGQTIELLWQEGQAPIAMNASLYGKEVTITGTATVDWSKGFLFVGRGGEGNATLIFNNANLTSASNSGSYGIHVSGREKNTNDKYDGTLVVNNSTIDLDYLINKGTMTLDESTLTVKNGFSVGGRPASETESGQDATATITLNNGSKVVVNNHNGMGLGYEAIGVMYINSGSTFETTQNFLITAKGTMNVDETSKIVNTNNSWINNKGVIKFNGSTLKDNYIDSEGATEFAGTINFEGNNSVITAEIKGSPFELIVKEDATLLISRFVLGYDRAITVYGNIEDAHNLTAEQIASMTPSLKFNSTSGVSVGGTATGRLTAEDAYLEFGNSSWKNSYAEHIWSFENCYVSATSFGNNNAQGNTTSTWDVTFDNSVLAAKNYIKNGVGVSYNFTNGSVATTGSMRIDGELNVDATSSVTTTAQQNNVAGAVDEHGGVNGTINIAGTLTIGSNATTQLEVLGGEVNVTETGNIILLENTLTLDATSKMRSCGNITGAITAEESTDIEITGGTYTQDVNEWCHEDYDAIDNGNNTWTVIQVAGTQTREFAYPGWYWFSTYIDFESGEDGLDELQEQLDDNAATIKGQTAFTNYQYYNGVPFWTSALTSISASEMYMIKTTNECLNQDEQIYENVSVSLEGKFVDYEKYEITIHKGWNWIGYPLNTEVSVRDALAGFTPAIGDQIKGKIQGTTSTYMSNNKWIPNFNMIPGEGYMYYSAASVNKTLTYSAGNGGTQNAKTSVEDNHWIVDEYKYSNNMTVIAMLSIDGEIVKGNYEVAAFANGECRGSARPIYIESIDAYVLFMTIHGDEVEELTFMYYDIDKDTEYELSNVMNYSNDAIVGTIDNPYIFSMNILGIGENSIDNINIYPNPTTTDREINLQAICDKVEVFNALGVKVAEYHNVDTLDALETAGIYVIRITNDNAVKHCRLVVK